MPPKRKKPPAHATRTSSAAEEANSSPPQPRRSTRRRPLNDVKDMVEPGVTLKPSGRELDGVLDNPAKRGSMHQQAWESKEGVRSVMKELSDMEERLRTDVKRQRLAIEDSDLVKTDMPRIEPPPYESSSSNKPRKEIINQSPDGPGAKLQPPEDELEAAPMSKADAEDTAYELQEDTNEMEIEAAQEPKDNGPARSPAVNSDYLPLPWKGRLGYACLNTYLRSATPPVFSSRTCRIASILQHRHPLQDPSLPEHPTKNRPDESKPKQIALGQKYVEALGIANAKDIPRMLRWNEKYGIRFMRLSSEMFPFASHEEYGYSLTPFASEALAEAGRVAAELGHRLTTHPGQFTQLGSPREQVVTAAVRDLEYHNELLSLLKLPEQQDRDAVMILHMGGTFNDKAATLDRFRKNYAKLSDGVKARLVLENDDVGWTVHDLLPICEELNIPMVLDFHHHNILHDSTKIREGTKDIMDLFPRIKATWTRKKIKQKMHYSESCPSAITPKDRRKHSPRVRTLPPCDPDMDLMIEAKDKEQAVFELMRAFRLPGHNLAADVIPYERSDENKPVKPAPKSKKKTPKKKKKKASDEDEDEPMEDASQEQEQDPPTPPEIPADEISMGGVMNRVYWPEGMEEWLRPKKREVKRSKSTKVLDGKGEDEE